MGVLCIVFLKEKKNEYCFRDLGYIIKCISKNIMWDLKDIRERKG